MPLLPNMSYEYYPITGIPVQPGQQAPPRRELASWSTSTVPEDQIQVSLFIRALQKMQDKNPLEELLSYFQIAGGYMTSLYTINGCSHIDISAGIHGYPVVPWDHAGQHGFYCTHGSITFPTWHRPYMLLYEVGCPR